MRKFIIVMLILLAPAASAQISPGALTHWHLLLHYVIPASATAPMQVSTQAAKRYEDPAATRVSCDTDGAIMVAILNNPIHVAPGNIITWTCGYF